MSSEYPRPSSCTQHALIAGASDYSEKTENAYNEDSLPAQAAKFFLRVVDEDRNAWARVCLVDLPRFDPYSTQESGLYATRMFTLDPPSCTPKNNIIAGWPPSRAAPSL